jgi:hypothetical protein
VVSQFSKARNLWQPSVVIGSARRYLDAVVPLQKLFFASYYQKLIQKAARCASCIRAPQVSHG